MMNKHGSQMREPIEDTEFKFLRTGLNDGEIVVRSTEDKHYELLVKRDDYAGYVVVFQGAGYEYVRRMTESEVLALP